MKFKSLFCLMAGLLTAFASVNSWAGTVLCTPGIFTYQATYSPTATADNVTPVSVVVNCLRNTTGTDGTVTLNLAFNNGAQPSGTQNIAKIGALTLNYEFYKEATCTTKLEDLVTLSSTPAAVIAASGISTPVTFNFFACVPKLQTATAPSSNYADTIQLTVTGVSSSPSVTYSSGSPSTTSSVTITAPPSCIISTGPGTVAFGSYSSLGAAAVGSTSFATNCANTLPYTMSLDNTFGVVAGLNYSLGLTANIGATTGTPTLSSTGTGVAQTFYIKGNMAAGQAGSCALGGCSGVNTDTRTLILTY